ncbi:MAG TPA: hypothetical protein VFS32_11040 [Candidatus Limnocylindrales bacterium]|nr:hypothetical protein [Candidatus Limnocylindrales bacterium]
MIEATAIRLLTFRTGTAGPVVDLALRDDALPYLETQHGLVDVFAGRHGVAGIDERILVTTWQTRSAMVAALGDDDVARLLPGHVEDIADPRVDVYDFAFGFRIDRDRPPRVLRIVRGEVRGDALTAFADDLHAVALQAAQMADGTIVFNLGIRRPAAFAAVSVWPDWTAIEQATGASVHDTSAILAPGRVVSARATHFEILGGEPALNHEDDDARETAAPSGERSSSG